ncbi:MAG TPA: HEAT repeat domain-containing protein, partial [Candidatus Caenarcaniphilales bacterium]
SIRALAAIADPRALEVLLTAAETDFAPSVRRAAAKGLGRLHWYQLPIAQVQAARERALKTLLLLAQDPDWSIRYAAVVGLHSLATSVGAAPSNWLPELLAQFEQIAQIDADFAVHARARMAQQQLQGVAPESSLQLENAPPAQAENA